MATGHLRPPHQSDGGSPRELQLVVAGLVALLIAVVAVTLVSLGSSERSSAGATHATKTLPSYWTVRRGQTYETIADKTGLTVDQLVTFNPYQDPYGLTPGQRIKLRMHPPARHRKRRLGPRTWTVRRGQSFASIAAKTGHSIYALQKLNPRLKPETLQPGQRLTLRR